MSVQELEAILQASAATPPANVPYPVAGHAAWLATICTDVGRRYAITTRNS